MIKRLVLNVLLTIALAFSPIHILILNAGTPYVSNDAFVPLKGDYMVADTENGVGYLIHSGSKRYTSFPLLSGQKRRICYAGRCYDATTPDRTWYVKEKNIQLNRVMFGKTGEFLRLYFEDGRTLYGIHGHKYFQNMLDKGNIFRSFGCLLVADDVLDLIEGSYLANGNELKVITTTDFVSVSLF